MKIINASLILAISLLSCKSAPKGTVLVKFYSSDSSYLLKRVDVRKFEKTFGPFYKDALGHFFIGSLLLADSALNSRPILIQIPRLDSATFIQDGQYLIDKTKVICVFDNSDGGNFVQLRNVNPASFKTFHNVFGGRDSSHVFFQNKLLVGVNPSTVKVYSSMQNCSNCQGYFVDRDIFYIGGNKIVDSAVRVPTEFRFVE